MTHKIFLASDHAGFELKNHLVKFLSKKYDVVDVGPHKFNVKDDYPDYVIPCAEKVVKNKGFGIVIGKTGEGEAIAANKVKGVRAVVYYGGSKKILQLSREHNDANVLSLGAEFISKSIALNFVNLWINKRFSKDKRHVRRLNKIDKYESRERK